MSTSDTSDTCTGCESPHPHKPLPQSVTLFCPKCGDAIYIRSPAVNVALEAHDCHRPPPYKKNYIVAAPPTRILMERMEHNCREYKRMKDEYDRVVGSAAGLQNELSFAQSEVVGLRSELADTQAALEAMTAERDKLKSKTTRSPSGSDDEKKAARGYEKMLKALRRVMAAPTRKRKFLALLHPDILKTASLCSHAKFIRESVSLE